jgi:hypothetical protein
MHFEKNVLSFNHNYSLFYIVFNFLEMFKLKHFDYEKFYLHLYKNIKTAESTFGNKFYSNNVLLEDTRHSRRS